MEELRNNGEKMPDYCRRFLLIGILVLSNCAVSVASDDNPWRIEAPDERQQRFEQKDFNTSGTNGIWGAGSTAGDSGSYFDLNRNGLQNLHRSEEKIKPQDSLKPNLVAPEEFGAAANKSPAKHEGTFTGRSQYEEKEQDRERQNYEFGYSGASQLSAEPNSNTGAWSNFGPFPPLEENKIPGKTDRQGVQFEGRSYGAFPPLEQRPAQQDRYRGRSLPQTGQVVPRSQFTNVPPPPVPDTWPDGAYPYGGYPLLPGYGTGFPASPLMLGGEMPWFFW